FQAEDGIRDRTVTGVQTCALPISRRTWRSLLCSTHVADENRRRGRRDGRRGPQTATDLGSSKASARADVSQSERGLAERELHHRSEERRVGKGGRCRGAPEW